MTTNLKLPNTLTILFGFGGSGGKTITQLAELLTNNPASARFANERVHVILCDTDEGELRKQSVAIERAFADRAPGLKLQVETFSLSANTDIFCDLVQTRLDGVSEAGMARLREHWWFEGKRPFSATGLPLATNAGAGQCPLVSHFLAWDKLSKFPEVLERIDAVARNERHMEDFAIDLIMVAGLAGGTGRGCWQLLSFKAREHFGRSGQACRPYGFFFDQSVFEDIQKGRPEQSVKMKINSLTGLSELAMWLRSDRRMPGEPPASDSTPPERRFRIPGFTFPENEAIDVLDTDRYIPEQHFARVGRSPIHKAYIFTNESPSTKVYTSDDVYALCAAAIYGRIAVTQTRSSDANQPARAAATATSILYVPASNIRKVILNGAKAARARAIVEGREGEDSGARMDSEGKIEIRNEMARNELNQLAAWLRHLVTPPKDDIQLSVARPGSEDRSIAEVLSSIWKRQAGSMDDLVTQLRTEGNDRERILACIRSGMTVRDAGFADDFIDATRRAIGIKDTDWEERRKSAKGRREDLSRLLVDALLAKLAGGEPRSIRRIAKASGNSLAAVVQSTHELLEVLKEAKSNCVKQRGTGPQSSTGEGGKDPAETLTDEYLSQRKLLGRIPLIGRFLVPSRIGIRQERKILEEIVRARRKASTQKALTHFEEFLDRLIPRVEQWELSAKVAVESVQGLASGLEARLQKELDAYFTRTDKYPNRLAVGRAILSQLDRDESSQVSKMVRRLRPVYVASQFKDTVRKTLNEHRELQAEQDLFLEELLGRSDGGGLDDERSIFFADARDSASDRHRFQNRIRQRMEAILAKQDAPESVIREFTLPKVLEGLMHLWFDLYRENSGDEGFARELDAAVERLTGISILKQHAASQLEREQGRSGSLEVPDPVTIVARTALKLGEKCDPLVKIPSRADASGDTVTIFVPDESFGSASSQAGEYCKAINELWTDFRNQFHHVRAESLTDNPFMLVATSDHPKRDFDQHGWSGWSSFDYHYLDTTLTEWLDMVEDDQGKSVFLQGKDDSIGLGFLHPQFVKDPHWARRRWRPWFNEQKRKTLDRRKWEALAYGLLGNEMYAVDGKRGSDEEFPFLARYRQFLKAVAAWGPVNPDFPKEAWTLPVIRETAGDGGPAFTRPFFTDREKVGLRCDGEDLRGKPMSRSVRSFMEWFRSDDSKEPLALLWDEQCAFARIVAQRSQELYDVLSPEHRQDIRKTLLEYVRRWSEYVRQTIRREDDRREQIAFLEEFEKVLTDPNFDLLKPFNGIQTVD